MDGSQTADFRPAQSLAADLGPPAAPPGFHLRVHQPAEVFARYNYRGSGRAVPPGGRRRRRRSGVGLRSRRRQGTPGPQ
ncbi:MAG: hypothetical protein ACK53Y_06145, partial [bacterium]